MLARPEVKRTYSRLKPPSTNAEDLIAEGEKGGNEDDYNRIIKPAALCELIKSESDAVEPKMKRITDFFRVKRESLDVDGQISTESPSPGYMSNSHTIPNMMDAVPSPVTSVSNKLKQTFLDLGQKNLVSIQCPDCLMHYNKSFPDDRSLHKKFHSNYLKGYNFNFNLTTSGCELIAEIAPDCLRKWSKYRFYEVKRFDNFIIKRMEFFLNFVHVQLGAEPLNWEELKSKPFNGIVSVEYSSGRIVGFGLFEECERVFKSSIGCDGSAIELDSIPISAKDENQRNAVFIGVSRIWVDEKHRTLGMASLLLDLKCKGFRDRIAFSQPTPSGFAFAKSFQRNQFKGLQCLIYLK